MNDINKDLYLRTILPTTMKSYRYYSAIVSSILIHQHHIAYSCLIDNYYLQHKQTYRDRLDIFGSICSISIISNS